MSSSKFNHGAKEGLSLQMALLHLRWQQIRQLELQQESLDSEEENTTSILATSHQAEKAYSMV